MNQTYEKIKKYFILSILCINVVLFLWMENQMIRNTPMTVSCNDDPVSSSKVTRGWRQSDSELNTSHSSSAIGWVRPDTIFGHFHIAKTAGTTINGALANRFERVCGHKGNSYDYHQYQKNLRFDMVENETAAIRWWMSKTPGLKGTVKALDALYNRGRVPLDILNYIGYEDCDYISAEFPMPFWKQFKNNHTQIEAHVPCRDIFEHFLSQCNFRHIKFDCSLFANDNIAKIRHEIGKCLVFPNRFRARSIRDYKKANFRFKCFDPMPPSRYIDYMANILQERRYVPQDDLKRETNRKRKREEECVWKMSQTQKDLLAKLLKKEWDLYAYCEECMGSEDELVLPEV
jgi:hypothetical protein